MIRSAKEVKRVAIGVLVALVWAVLFVPQQSGASSLDSWPVTISEEQRAEQVLAHANGAVSVFRCSSGGDPTSLERTATTYSSSSSQSGTVPGTDGEWLCASSVTVGNDASVYGTKYNSSTQRYEVVGYQGGSQLWAPFELAPECSSPYSYTDVAGMAVGSDNDLYVLVNTAECSGRYFLLGLDGTTGQQKFKKLLGTSDGYSNLNRSYVVAYQNGLVVRHGLNDATFRYFSYAGVEDTAKAYTPTFTSGDMVLEWGATYGGGLFLSIVNHDWSRPGPCTLYELLDRVVKHVPGGTDTVYDMVSYCADVSDLAITPQGTAAVSRGSAPAPEGGAPVYFLQTNGDVLPTNPSTTEDYSPETRAFVQAGINGNVLMQRTLYKSSGAHYFTEYSLLSYGGSLLARTTSEAYYDENSGHTSYMAGAEASLANGFVYTLLCERTPNYGCATTRLHKLAFAEAAFEYPRGLVNGATVPQVGQRNYVVLGDSYAAVEGVPPFIEGTDDDSVETYNQCHRSQKAYAKLLDEDSSTNLTLKAFSACSGAKIQDMYVPQYSSQTQPGQLLTLDTIANEDAVTVSIGGNDADFEPLLMTCTTEGEAACATARAASRNKINNVIPDDLEELFADIAEKVPPTAKVVVVEYPQIFPMPADKEGDCKWTNPSAIGDRDITDTELTDMISMGNLLNTKLYNAATAAGFEFADVSAGFAGKQVCTSGNVFNINMLEDLGKWNYHPNATAQPIYRDAIKVALN